MERSIILNSIRGHFRQSIISPLNPFTLDNPDALVFNGHSLLGLFIPLAKELRNPDYLLRRLFYSRLALINTISSVLILDGDNEWLVEKYYQIRASYDSVIVFDRIRDLLLFLSDEIHPEMHFDSRLKIRRVKLFWGIMDFLEKTGIENNGYDRPIVINGSKVQRWSDLNKMYHSKNIGFSYPYLMATKQTTKESFMQGLESILTFAAMYNYSLIDGRLRSNPEAEDTFMFLNLEDLEPIRKAPIYLRTLAFMGYLPGCVGKNFNFQLQRERYNAFLKENNYL